MMVFVLVFVAMVTTVAAMAVGVMAGRKPIAGSCGGLAQLGLGGECEICGGDPTRCEAPDVPNNSSSDLELGHDATAKNLGDHR